MSLERFWIWCLERLQRGLTLPLDLHLDSPAIKPSLEAREVAVRLIDVVRHVALEMADLRADRVRQRHPDPADERESGQVDEQDRESTWNPMPVEQPDERVQDQRDRARAEQDQQDRSGSPARAPTDRGPRAGRTTSWTQRGTTTGAGDTGARSRPGLRRGCTAGRGRIPAQPLGIGTLAALAALAALAGGGRGAARSPGNLKRMQLEV